MEEKKKNPRMIEKKNRVGQRMANSCNGSIFGIDTGGGTNERKKERNWVELVSERACDFWQVSRKSHSGRIRGGSYVPSTYR